MSELTTVVGETVVTGHRLITGAQTAINGACCEGSAPNMPSAPLTGSAPFAHQLTDTGNVRIVHVGSTHPAPTVVDGSPV